MAGTLLADYQHRIGDDGFIVGGVAAGNESYLLDFGDWTYNAADAAYEDQEYPATEGTRFGADRSYGLHFEFSVVVVGSDPTDVEARIGAFADSMDFDHRTPGFVVPYRFKRPGKPQFIVWGRARKFDVDWSTIRRGWARVDYTFDAETAFVYEDNLISLALTLASDPQNPAGITEPVIEPVFEGGFVTGGNFQGTIFNPSRRDAWAVVEFDGETTNPRLDNNTTGEFIELASAIAVGHNITVDSNPGRHTVLRDNIPGQSVFSQFSTTGSKWMRIVYGVNGFSYRAQIYNAASTVRISARPTHRLI